MSEQESLEKKVEGSRKLFENSPFCAYASGKQEWKANGNYYTAEELAQFEEDMRKDFESGKLIFNPPRPHYIDAT